MKDLREKSEVWREKLKEAKDKFPGIVIDKQAWVVGPDGVVKKLEVEMESIQAALDKVREELEKANVPKETIDQLRKAVEDVISKSGEAAGRAAVGAIREYRNKKQEKLEKKDGEKSNEAPPAESKPAPAQP